MARLDTDWPTCYERLLDKSGAIVVMPSKPCTSCGISKPIFGAGKCHACFAEWGQSVGLLEEQMPKQCAAPDCNAFAQKRGGLCDRHYRRFADHGTTDKVRQDGKGEQMKHPFYQVWLRLRKQGRLEAGWLDFWAFVSGVGQRPSARHRLVQADITRLMGPHNFAWRMPVLDMAHSFKNAEGRASYHQARRAVQPRDWVGANLQRYYGISVEQYGALLAAQGAHCALCDRTQDISPSGEPQLLAVDHDHKTGEIRGLLCRHHNQMLGHAGDNPDVLRRAAEYLERGAHTGLFVAQPGDVSTPAQRSRYQAGQVCSVEGCGALVKAKGLCNTHYARLMRNGSPDLQPKVVERCSHEGCDRPVIAKGYCGKHYEYFRRKGTLAGPALRPVARCTVDGCTSAVVARGLCDTHYARWKRHGSPDVVHDTRGRLLTCDTPTAN